MHLLASVPARSLSGPDLSSRGCCHHEASNPKPDIGSLSYRCRVKGGHPSITCEQYEAKRGHEDVCQCPGCGMYVVKGDGETALNPFRTALPFRR